MTFILTVSDPTDSTTSGLMETIRETLSEEGLQVTALQPWTPVGQSSGQTFPNLFSSSPTNGQ